MIYSNVEYTYCVGIACYGEFVGKVQGAEYHTLENAIDHMNRLIDEGFEKNLLSYEKLCVHLLFKRRG